MGMMAIDIPQRHVPLGAQAPVSAAKAVPKQERRELHHRQPLDYQPVMMMVVMTGASSE